jgi:DNA adenine methylase
MLYASPLRYPGGKHSLTEFIAETLRINGLTDCKYVEPFAGGAGAALNLLVLEHVGSIHLNDLDDGVYCFWKSVITKTSALAQLIRKTEVSVAEWHRQRAIAQKGSKVSQLDRGFAFFFLNRCNRSGVFNAGPIGGQKQTGNYLIDARFNREDLISRIEAIAEYKDRIFLSKRSAIPFLKTLGDLQEDYFVYLDPPYYEKGKSLYARAFEDRDHRRLAKYLQGQPFPWLLTYDDVPFIRDLYRSAKNVIFLNYCVRSVRVGRELVIPSPKCKLPKAHLDQTINSAQFRAMRVV